MVKISQEVISGVEDFLKEGKRDFLGILSKMDRNDIQGQAVVRYLMQIKHWPFTPNSEFDSTLNHFFAEYPERTKREPSEYQATTFDLIKESFGYECVIVVHEPKPAPEKKPNPGKVTRRPKMVKEDDVFDEPTEAGAGKSGSRIYKSLAGDVDTSLADDHLKRAIAIQRGQG